MTYLVTSEAAEYLRRSPRHVRELKSRDALPYRQPVPNGRTLYVPEELDAWLAGAPLETIALPGGGRCVRPKATARLAVAR